MTLMRIFAVDYFTDDEEPVVKIAGRDEHGERNVHYVEGTRPYLYVLEGQEVPEDEEFRVVEKDGGYQATDPRNEYHDAELEKWVCRVPDDVGELAGYEFETWESDIPYYRRCSIDYDLSGYVRIPDERTVHIDDVEADVEPEESIEPRVVFGDIEVLSGNQSFDEMVENAEQKITNITLYDSHTETYDAYILDPDREVSSHDLALHLKENGLDPQETTVNTHYAPNERALLDSFLGYFESHRPDLTTGWNWVEFDILYLLRRIKRLYDEGSQGTKRYNLDLDRLSDAGGTSRNHGSYHGQLARAVSCVPAVDMMTLFAEKMVREGWRSKALEYVSHQVLERGKVEDVSVNEGYQNHRSELAAYNIIDVELCVAIDQKRGVIEFFQQLAELSQVQIYDTFSEMRLVDGFLMAHHDDDEILPPQPDDADIPENAGGLVLKPSNGIVEWVGVMDLKSLYPSSMITWNISPETVGWQRDFDGDPDLIIPWVPEASNIGEEGEYDYPLTGDDVGWTQLGASLEEEGIVPKYLKLLFADRGDAKAERDQYDPDSDEYERWDRVQYALKVLMNSFYGVSSNDYWRLGKHGLGDAITSASRYALFKGKQVVERIGYGVKYGDTDSAFIDLDRDEGHGVKQKAVLDGKGLTSQVNDAMVEAVRESGLDGAHPHIDPDGPLPHARSSHCLRYEFEKLYRRYVQFGKKKRYAGLIVWKEGKDVDTIDVTGFETKRSDTPELTERAQKEVLRKVLAGEGFEGVSAYISGLCDDIKNADIELRKIARPKSIGKPRDQYDAVTQTLKACEVSEMELGKAWRQGDDPFLYFVDETPAMTPDYPVVALDWDDELPDGWGLNHEEHTRIALRDPIQPIIDELGWSWKEVKTGAKAGSALDGNDWGTAEEDGGKDSPSSTTPGDESQDGDGASPERGNQRVEEDGNDDSNADSGGALSSDW